MKRIRSALIVIGVLWLAVGLFMLRNPAQCVKGDSEGYLKLATNLRLHSAFSTFDAEPFDAETTRVPGYPLFLSAFQAIASDPLPLIIVAQMILAFAAIALLVNRFLPLSSPRAIQTIVVLWGLDVVYLFHAPQIMAESLFIFVLVLGVLALLRAVESPSVASVAVAGFLIGLTMLIRPVSMLLPLVLCPLFWKRKPLILVFFLAAYLLPNFWCVRNVRAVGLFELTSQGGVDLLRYPAASVLGMVEGKSREQAEMELRAGIDKEWPNAAVRSEAYRREAKRIMLEHPFLTIKFHVFGALRILGGTGLELLTDAFAQPVTTETSSAETLRGAGTKALLRHFPVLIPILLIYLAMLAALYGFYGIGIRALITKRLHALAYLLVASPLYFLVVSSHQGYYRYRIPLLPFLMAGAAIGLAAWMDNREKSQQKV